ncbi:MAG: hypothetical protein AAF502_12775 [Bacteroidota bacterium]
MKSFGLLLIGTFLLFSSCKLSKSYTVTKLNEQVSCNCDSVNESIRFFKKSYKSEKSIEVYGDILVPIDRIREEYYVYSEFKVIKDCTEMEFDKSEDEFYFVITPEQWEKLKAYDCN